MKTELKTDLLLRMTEQPDLYTEEQWYDILSDEECRELYTMMAMTKGALDAARAEDGVKREGSSVKARESRVKGQDSKFNHQSSRFTRSLFTFKKVAAIFLAVVFLGGLSFAAYRILSPRTNSPRPAQVSAPSLQGRAGGGSSIRFSDVRLDSILSVVAAHYGKAVCFRDTTTSSLRLNMVWDSSDSLAVFIETLNEFDRLRLCDERDTIFVESVTVEAKE